MSSKGKVVKIPRYKRQTPVQYGNASSAVPLTRPIRVDYGHNGESVLVQFSDKVANLTMDIVGAEAFATNILKVAASLRQHRGMPAPDSQKILRIAATPNAFPPGELFSAPSSLRPEDAVPDGKAPIAPPTGEALTAAPSAAPGPEGDAPNQEHPHA